MISALTIEELSAGYGRRAVVTGITLPALPAGSVTALTGPNGAGKSTMLKALAGFLPASGAARLDGEDILTMRPQARARAAGFMPQALPGDVGLTVLDAVITALKVTRPELSIAAARERAGLALERLGIVDLALSALGRLSGGQKQMASLAQAIVTDPKLLLLDEPVSALDLHHQFHVMRTIRSLAAEGRIIIAVLHDLEMASKWADRIVVMRQGRLFDAGRPADVVTAAMLRDVYRIHARVAPGEGASVRIAIDDIVTETSGEKTS